MHEMLKGHVVDDAGVHKDHGERIVKLEANQDRDAEDRAAEATGRFNAVPPPARATKPPPKEWWGQEPFKSVLKYALTAAVAILFVEVCHRLGLPVPSLPK